MTGELAHWMMIDEAIIIIIIIIIMNNNNKVKIVRIGVISTYVGTCILGWQGPEITLKT
jgi:hypothetical protein